MKIDWTLIATILVAMLVFKVLDALFLDSLVANILPSNFEDLEGEEN